MKVMIGAMGLVLIAVLATALYEHQKATTSAPLEELPKQELYERARRAGVDGRSRMTKAELVTALRNTA